ncbi:hypothetical protein ROS62_09330 [Streptomyces sp. DSM 41972]|uniref:Uncharacterized protein n=1 Tax=Streptomyces althioticus subsp. attaecolombicae TaxID=3075534 RepID=A0ABU3HWP7_9ACTN|nr:hypothetical protein [Streptomyces sp. DSM 41972]
MTQSGQGEEPSARPAHEGIVLPSDGGVPLRPSMTSGPVASDGTDGAPAGGGFPASAPPGGQTWGNPWGPDQQAAAPPAGREWPSAHDGQWQQQSPSGWDAGHQQQGGHGQQPSWDAGAQAQGGRPQGGPGPLPPEGAPSQGGYPPAHGGQDAYGQGGGYAATDGYGQAAAGVPYGGHTAGGQLPPQNGAAYAAPGGGYGYPPAHGAPLPPPAPGADEGATQVMPPVPAGGADEGATQYIPPVPAGALPPERPAAHDAELTRNLGVAQPQAGPGPLPQPGSPDSEPTQFIAPVTDQGPPQPYGAAQGDEGRQPPAEFDNLFRNDDGEAGTTQQMPRVDYGRPAPADRTPPVPPASNHGGGRGGGGGNGGPRWPLIAAVGVGLAVVGVGAGALLGSGSEDDDAKGNQPVSATAPASTEASPSPTVDPAREQAVELDKLLAHSGDSRSSVIDAVEDVKACRDLDQAASDLREAAKQREQLVTDLSGLSVDKLPEHEALSEALRKAWKASASADDHYAKWAEQAKGRKVCRRGTARNTEQTAEGNRESGTATEQKKKASELWNAIARQYGLTERAPTQL